MGADMVGQSSGVGADVVGQSSDVGADVAGQSSAECLGEPGRGAGGVAAGCSVGCCDACFGEVGRGLTQGRMGCRRSSDDAEKFGIFM